MTTVVEFNPINWIWKDIIVATNFTTLLIPAYYLKKYNKLKIKLKTATGIMGASVFKLTCSIVTDDLSDHKPATQSTTYLGPHDIYKAGNAVDRNTATCIRTDAIGPNSPDKTVWWKVDLGGMYNIYSVNILFKNYDGYGMLLLIIIARKYSLLN